MAIEHEASSDYQIHPRFYVDWKGHQEDDFTVVDGRERMAIVSFSSQELGTMNARRLAFQEASKRNYLHYSSEGFY